MSGTTEESSSDVFGPREEVGRPLGREIRLRVDVEGVNGLPVKTAVPQHDDARRLYLVSFYTVTDKGPSDIGTSGAYEGSGSLQGTVQWNETLYIRCLEMSYIRICLDRFDTGDRDVATTIYETCMPAMDFVSAGPPMLLNGPGPDHNSCNMFLSVTRFVPEGEEETCDLSTSCLHGKHARRHVDPTALSGVWGAAFRQMSILLEIASQFKVTSALGNPSQSFLYEAYQAHHNDTEGIRQLDEYAGKAFACMQGFTDVMRRPVARSREQIKKDYTYRVMYEVYFGLRQMHDAHWPSLHHGYEAESARLAWIIVTPDPSAAPTGDPATIAKDALLLVLDAIVQSSDAFPPLKSAASGLLFFATCADMACGNKKQIRDMYKRIQGLAASLKRGTKQGGPITPEHQDAIEVLATDIESLKGDLEGIISERKSRFKRFFSAKRHRAELKDVVEQLETAKSNYTTALATLNAVTIAEVNSDVRAIALVLNARGVYMPGTRRKTLPTDDTSDENFSLDVLVQDIVHLLPTAFPDPKTAPTFFLVGHTLGYRIGGVAVLDVVEGSALEALPLMPTIIALRPVGFDSPEEAIEWHVSASQIRNATSARVSVPSLIVPAPSDPGTLRARAFVWRTPLGTTGPYWESWFRGLSASFLSARTARLLIPAGTDRLDKELMIGQMQGKVQMEVVPGTGHMLHEDDPVRLAEILVEFWRRNDRVVVGVKKVGEL
ncbi:unnamed protein product [Peniophora sp. CBMAI 1063]|nr:unnamed protein product [Peniophora sp. CBMAI 1063]